MLVAFAGRQHRQRRRSQASTCSSKPHMEGPEREVAECNAADIAQLPELALELIFSALDVRSLAAVSLACTSWHRRIAALPQLYRSAFWQRFGNKADGGWWPFFESEDQLLGYRNWLRLYQAALYLEGVVEARVLGEALKRQLYHREQYQKALEANRQVVLVCERSLGKAQAAMERHASARGLLSFGRREGAARATLRTDVEHWQRELADEQATVRGLEPLLAQAVGKVARIQARAAAIQARRGALLEARPQLGLTAWDAGEERVIKSMVDKFALPRLRARIATAYMFYDKAAHAVR